jgi:hypothetical protein
LSGKHKNAGKSDVFSAGQKNTLIRTPGKSCFSSQNRQLLPSSNNKAEREIRPAVLMRKASYGSASDKGAETRSILMSIYRTLKQRGLDPLKETETALRQFMTAGQLPPLPTKISSGG